MDTIEKSRWLHFDTTNIYMYLVSNNIYNTSYKFLIFDCRYGKTSKLVGWGWLHNRYISTYEKRNVWVFRQVPVTCKSYLSRRKEIWSPTSSCVGNRTAMLPNLYGPSVFHFSKMWRYMDRHCDTFHVFMTLHWCALSKFVTFQWYFQNYSITYMVWRYRRCGGRTYIVILLMQQYLFISRAHSRNCIQCSMYVSVHLWKTVAVLFCYGPFQRDASFSGL